MVICPIEKWSGDVTFMVGPYIRNMLHSIYDLISNTFVFKDKNIVLHLKHLKVKQKETTEIINVISSNKDSLEFMRMA